MMVIVVIIVVIVTSLDFQGPETAAVLRSMEAHIGSRQTTLIDVADFLSAWRCAAGGYPPPTTIIIMGSAQRVHIISGNSRMQCRGTHYPFKPQTLNP